MNEINEAYDLLKNPQAYQAYRQQQQQNAYQQAYRQQQSAYQQQMCIRDSVSPHETKNPNEFVTEVCFPIRKK